MKLAFRITSRISIVLLILMAVWAAVFYFIIVEEINDETDDALEDYAENIIVKALTGESLPSKDNGTNNSYYLSEVTPAYASMHPAIRYYDEMVYIHSKKETEPARILKTIFRDAESRYFELTVLIPTIEKADLQEAILYWIIILYIALLLVIIGLNYVILHRSFRPLYKLLGWLDGFSVEKKFTQPDISTQVTEFKRLNEAIVRSSYRNIKSYEQQKSFIGNASHELQTPLAACFNRLEMLAEDQQLTEKQLEEVLKTKQSLAYAIKLNKTLLLLTKIENDQFPEKKQVSVAKLIRKLADDYAEVYANRKISLSIHVNDEITVHMNETLASVLFGNLLKNAFVHNHTNGKIRIYITEKQVAVANTGVENALQEDSVFDRFYKGSAGVGSTGLGLALSKSICNLYNMRIGYRYLDEQHIFTVVL